MSQSRFLLKRVLIYLFGLNSVYLFYSIVFLFFFHVCIFQDKGRQDFNQFQSVLPSPAVNCTLFRPFYSIASPYCPRQSIKLLNILTKIICWNIIWLIYHSTRTFTFDLQRIEIRHHCQYLAFLKWSLLVSNHWLTIHLRMRVFWVSIHHIMSRQSRILIDCDVLPH